jgi:Transcriptional Coactivator p15 (PC4)
MTMTVMAQQAAERNSRAKESEPKQIIAEWPINRREHARVSIENYRGTWLCDIRKWFETADGERRPGLQGIALNVAQLPQLARAIADAQSTAREHGLITDNVEGTNDRPR